MKDQLSPAGCGVDILLQGFEAYCPVMKLGYGVDQMSQTATEAI